MNLLPDDYTKRMELVKRKFIRTGLPFVHLKVTLTQDGAIQIYPGKKSRLSGDLSRERIHLLRGWYDAILIGAETARCDDPQLTYRGSDGWPQPRKVILSRTGNLPANLRCFQGAPPIVCSHDTIHELVQHLASAGIKSVLVEGGGSIFEQFLDANAWDFLSIIRTPHVSQDPRVTFLKVSAPSGSMFCVGEDRWTETYQEMARPEPV